MASIIRIKRSSTSGDPSVLGAGELAYSSLAGTQSNGGDRIYVGVGTETGGDAADHHIIGGKYFTDLLDHAHGTLTASSALIVDASSKVDVFNVDNLTLDGNTLSSTNTNGNILLDPNGSGYVKAVGTNFLVIPAGGTGDRTTGVQGAVRYNTTISQFEGYSGTDWSSLGGVRSVDGLTYISAELTPGSSDDTLRFYSDNTLQMSLDTDSLDISTTVTTVNINATTASTSTTTGALVVDGGVGIAGDLYVGGTFNLTGSTVVTGDFNLDGGDLFSTATTFNLLNQDGSASVTNDGPTTVNAFLNATTIDIGATTGTTNINNNLVVDGTTTLGTIATPTATTIHGTTVDVNATGAVTVDALEVSLDATTSSNFTLSANSSSNQTLSFNAVNSGAGEALINVGSATTNTVNVTSSDLIDLTSAEVQVDVTTFDVNASGTITLDATTSAALTTTTTTINSDTINVFGTAGAGNDATIDITGQVDIDNIRIDGNTIYSTDGSNTLYLDPAPMNNNGGTVVIKGDLQVDGTTTTINSTEVTIDDPVFTLGGDTAPTTDDNLDRGIKFNWYDSTAASAMVGFFGWDDSLQKFVFIADATETSATFAPTTLNEFADLVAGSLDLTLTTASTSTTTGALTVAGGVGVSGQLNVGGATNKFTASTASTSTTTGAVVVTGGVGVGGTIYVGTDLVGSGAATSDLDGFNIDGGTY